MASRFLPIVCLAPGPQGRDKWPGVTHWADDLSWGGIRAPTHNSDPCTCGVDAECADKTLATGDFPGGPVVKTLRFHCRGHGFDPWLGN